VQYLYSIGINSDNTELGTYAILLGTKPRKKREKVAWILRELSDYQILPNDMKRAEIQKVYSFVGQKPYLLIKSIKFLSNNKERLQQIFNQAGYN